MKPLIYTQELLADLGTCDPAVRWAVDNIAEGTPITRKLLESLPDPLWVWWLACRLDDARQLVWLAPNIAFREAGTMLPELTKWAGEITADNWQGARAAVREAAVNAHRATRAADAADRAAVREATANAHRATRAAAWAADAAEWAAADPSEWAVEEEAEKAEWAVEEEAADAAKAAEWAAAAVRAADTAVRAAEEEAADAVQKELTTAAIQWLVDNGFAQ